MDKSRPISVKKRRYQQVCPIARALNHVGDRWALLILRDLHAGPARFVDLQKGLTGIATNLLSTRLHGLLASGLIHQRDADFGARVYELTELGRGTDALLLALADFGAKLAPETETKAPGNLRLLALRLQDLFQRAVEKDAYMELEFSVGGEALSIRIHAGHVRAELGADPGAEVRVECPLDALIQTLEGRLDGARFVVEELNTVSGESSQLARVQRWLQQALKV